MRFNIAVAAVLLMLAGYIFLAASALPLGTLRAPQTAFFPKTLALSLAVLSVILSARSLAGRERSRASERIDTAGWFRIGATVATMAGFALVLERLGYLIATFLLMVLLLRAIEAQSWSKIVGVALATALISYALFAWLLGVPLPAGFLGI